MAQIEKFELKEVPKEYRQEFTKIKYILMKIKSSREHINGDEYYYEQLVLDKKGYIKYDNEKEKWILTEKGDKFLKGLERIN